MKDTFFKSTIILIIGGALIKILGMIIKILMNRIVGIETMSLYMLIFPTFSLFMTISQLGLPTAITKLVSEEKYNNKKLIFSIIPVSLFFNLTLMLIIILLAPLIAYFLNDQRVIIPIMSISIVLPFDSLSSILRGYFLGKQKMLPHIISLLFEQITRLLILLLLIPKLINKGIIYTTSILIGMNMVSEFISIIVLVLFIKNKEINLKDIKIINKDIKKILNIALPTTASRLIGSISYFLEPIIITTCLLNVGFDKKYVIEEYGIIEGFVLPLLLMPSFLTNALSGAIIPDISKKHIKKDLKGIKRRIRQVLSLSLIIGIIYTLIVFNKPDKLLMFLYKTEKGKNYIKFLCPFFILYYIESSLEGILQAVNKSKSIMINNLIGTILKLTTIFVLSYLKIGLYNLIIGIIINIFVITFLHIKQIKKELSSSYQAF